VGPARVATSTRPAFYALRPGGWRDYVTLLHPPYTLWHLSYVAIGAGLAPDFSGRRLGAALAAFLLAMGVGAHALDELKGRPLQTRISPRVLVALAAASIALAVAIGVASALAWTLWLLPFVAFGGFIVVAYNLELFRGRFHNDFWFAFSWGAFPLLTGYFVVAEEIRIAAVLAALFAALQSHAQRLLSTPVRFARRRVRAVSGTIELVDGGREEVTLETLLRIPERALQVLAASTVALGTALIVFRL
jgi:heme O synthase-like polyprenyltransferase